jgi:hypothetical protein
MRRLKNVEISRRRLPARRRAQAKDNEGAAQVLLVPNIFVGRHEDFEPALLGSFDQFPVFEFFPAAAPCFLHGMAGQKVGKFGLPVARGLL